MVKISEKQGERKAYQNLLYEKKIFSMKEKLNVKLKQTNDKVYEVINVIYRDSMPSP